MRERPLQDEVESRLKKEVAVALIRQLDALERLFYHYGQQNPSQHSIVAEFDISLDAGSILSALDAVRRRHPLLSAHVEDDPVTGLRLCRTESVVEIALTVHPRDVASWTWLAVEELRLPFDRSTAPLLRAHLIKAPTSSVLALTFDHTIADGMSAVIVLRDLVAALNGLPLPSLPTPPSVEEMIARSLPSASAKDTSQPAADSKMSRPSSIRRFDGAPTNVVTMAMPAADTVALLRKCREEGTTVHAAIVAAAARVRDEERGEGFIRVVSPINVRPLLSADDDCADYLVFGPVGLAPGDGSSLWDQARAVTRALEVARSPEGVLAASTALSQAMTPAAGTVEAELLMCYGLPYEIYVTNLGVQDLDGAGPIRPTALWGPLVQAQGDGEYIVGVVTYQGQIRFVACGYTVPDTFLSRVSDVLTAAVG